jgi:hypothetical protein
MPHRIGSLGLVLLCALSLPGCDSETVYRVDLEPTNPRFNPRVKADFTALQEGDAVDLTRGFFRDGGPDQVGVVSELYPVSGSNPAGPGALVQTPCLFVGAQVDPANHVVAADELRLVWELVAQMGVTNVPDYAKELFATSDMNLGLCTMSTVDHRLVFENPQKPFGTHTDLICKPQSPGLQLPWFRLPKEDVDTLYNVPVNCVVGHPINQVVLQAVARREVDAEGVCPAGRFDGDAVAITPDNGGSGWFDGAWSACGYSPNHVVPAADATYRLSLTEENDFGNAQAERFLSPSVLVVRNDRSIARPMTPPATAGAPWRWETKVDPPNGGEAAVRWAENFTPSVQVRGIGLFTRGASGPAVPAMPSDRRLTIAVPRPGQTAISVVCTLSASASQFTYPDDCVGPGDQPALTAVGPLTPTYATASLTGTPRVTIPVAWSAKLGTLPMGHTAFIRFDVVARSGPPLLSLSSLVDFGRRQKGGWAEGEVLLRNLGGQPLRVRRVSFATGSAHPGDFSFVVAGDPVEVPLPIAATDEGDGRWALKEAPDAADAPLLVVKEQADGVRVSLGDPDRGPTPAPLTLYGQPARFVGRLLMRDDPAAVFTPSGPDARPFSVTAYAPKPTPFVVAAGDTVTISVIAKPTAVGTRSAFLRVDAEPLAGGPALWAQSALRVESIEGPQLRMAPERLWFNRTTGPSAASSRRAVVIFNVGSLDLEVTQMQIQGPDAARFSFSSASGNPPPRMPSGGYADLWITYAPQCDGTYGTPTSLAEHTATLAIRSTGGNLDLRLSGSSYGFCELP